MNTTTKSPIRIIHRNETPKGTTSSRSHHHCHHPRLTVCKKTFQRRTIWTDHTVGREVPKNLKSFRKSNLNFHLLVRGLEHLSPPRPDLVFGILQVTGSSFHLHHFMSPLSSHVSWFGVPGRANHSRSSTATDSDLSASSSYASNKTVFGAILRNELPATILYEDERVLCFRDIRPVSKHHSLVIPKRHIAHSGALTRDDRVSLPSSHLRRISNTHYG